MAQPIGFCFLNPEIKKTEYLFGNIKELEGKLLTVLGVNKERDFLCITEKGLIDISACDVLLYVPLCASTTKFY